MTTIIGGNLPAPKQIRFVNNQGQPPSKRRRINAACLTCRKRKTRCAGERPSCSTCTKNGHTCLGYNDFVERRSQAGGLGRRERDPSATDLTTDADDDYLDDGNEDEEYELKLQSAHGGQNGGKPHHFGGSRSTPRRDSASSVGQASGTRLRTQSDEWERDHQQPHHTPGKHKRPTYPRTVSFSEDSRSSHNRSPILHHNESNRVPYFRYFGPTAIVPGYKQMVVNVSVRDRRRSRGGSFSATSPGSILGHGLAFSTSSQGDAVLENLEDMPVYDPNDIEPVHPLIINLIKTFFVHLGCNYPFLREKHFVRMVKEKRVESILVDAMCSLSARFSDLPVFTAGNDITVSRSEFGQAFAQRAKAATVDTFPCPTVGAVQACLLMAYEGFGSNQDSALWMYLGIAIRMAVDLGLQKKVGITYQGEKDPWYTRTSSRKNSEDESAIDTAAETDNDEQPSPQEQREIEQERIDTFWAVFILDRVISSGTGRPVTFRDDDFELSLPEPTLDPVSGWPAPFPVFIQVIHLYGRASDVLNNLRDTKDLTRDKMNKLAQMEVELTNLYQKQDPRLHFNASNFQEYVKVGQGTTFILLHFWFHALIIILHQPTLLAPFDKLSRTHDLSATSRELSISSAKTIADILAFAELIDPKSFIGNPFTSQPMYIAACAFLMESATIASQPTSRDISPPQQEPRGEAHKQNFSKAADGKTSKHSLLASAANQNYQRCYKSLQQLNTYWGGVKYILTALDQKSKGIWDVETYTNEEYESTKTPRRAALSRFPRFENPSSPSVPPIAWSLTGTTNSPNSSLTLLYQNTIANGSGQPVSGHSQPAPPPPPPPPQSAATPPGNMIYDPIRQSLPDTTAMFPPAYPQPNVSAVRYSGHPSKAHRLSASSQSGHATGKSFLKYESFPMDETGAPMPGNDAKLHTLSGFSQGTVPTAHSYTPSPHQPATYETATLQIASPASSIPDTQHAHHSQTSHHNSGHTSAGSANFQHDFVQSGLAPGSYSYLGGAVPITDVITFDSQEIDIGALGLPGDMMPPWLEYLPGDVLGLFESGFNGGGQGHNM